MSLDATDNRLLSVLQRRLTDKIGVTGAQDESHEKRQKELC